MCSSTVITVSDTPTVIVSAKTSATHYIGYIDSNIVISTSAVFENNNSNKRLYSDSLQKIEEREKLITNVSMLKTYSRTLL